MTRLNSSHQVNSPSERAPNNLYALYLFLALVVLDGAPPLPLLQDARRILLHRYWYLRQAHSTISKVGTGVNSQQ
jgi:hypothetical protein